MIKRLMKVVFIVLILIGCMQVNAMAASAGNNTMIPLNPVTPPTVYESPGVPILGKVIIAVIGIVLIIGFALTIAGILLKANQNKKLKVCNMTTKGKVIDLVKSFVNSNLDDGAPSYVYRPKIEYKVGENVYTKLSGSGSNPAKYEIGQEIIIHYNPNNCEQYYIEGDNVPQKVGTILLAVGIPLFVVALMAAIVVAKLIAY